MNNSPGKNIPFIKSDSTDNDMNSIAVAMKAAAAGHPDSLNTYEKLFSERTGIPHTIAVNSSFSAVLLSLKALAIKQGDEVIVSSFSAPEIGGAIEHSGASTVFADIEPDTLNISPPAIKEKINGKTKAVIIGDTAGLQVDMNAVMKLAASNGIYVIHYTYYNPSAIYCKGETAPCPHMTVFTHDEQFVKGAVMATGMDHTAARIARLAGHGIETLKQSEDEKQNGSGNDRRSGPRVFSDGVKTGIQGEHEPGEDWYYEIVNPGFDCRMTGIQSAFHTSYIRTAQVRMDRRKAIAEMYTGLLKPVKDKLILPSPRDSAAPHSWQLYIIRIIKEALGVTRDEFVKELSKKGIEVRVHYIPLHIQPYYSKKYRCRYNDLINTYESYISAVSLPLYASLADDDVKYVAQTLIDIVKKFAR